MSIRILVFAMLATVATVSVAAEEETPPTPAYPLTDIYMAELEFAEGNWTVGDAINIT